MRPYLLPKKMQKNWPLMLHFYQVGSLIRVFMVIERKMAWVEVYEAIPTTQKKKRKRNEAGLMRYPSGILFSQNSMYYYQR